MIDHNTLRALVARGLTLAEEDNNQANAAGYIEEALEPFTATFQHLCAKLAHGVNLTEVEAHEWADIESWYARLPELIQELLAAPQPA